MAYNIHVNHEDQTVFVSFNDHPRLEELIERSKLPVAEAVLALVRGVGLPLGTYPMGSVDSEGEFVVFYGESSYPMSMDEAMWRKNRAELELIGVEPKDVEVKQIVNPVTSRSSEEPIVGYIFQRLAR